MVYHESPSVATVSKELFVKDSRFILCVEAAHLVDPVPCTFRFSSEFFDGLIAATPANGRVDFDLGERDSLITAIGT